jgi:uncharacterized protein (TIGR03492 family)
MKLLCLSNGHGEDEIAVQILQALHQQQPEAEFWGLPIVGTGNAYHRSNIQLWSSTKAMPSGGFVNMDRRQLWRDLQGGLVGLTWQQWQAVRQWAGQGGQILAVGDIVPLLMARLSGASYGFVGTAKSEYYLRDRQGQILPHRQNSLEARSGSVYFPWERWLLKLPQCQGVFPRDPITAQKLQEFQIPAQYRGNPMMDDLQAIAPPSQRNPDALPITLLPGSRPPEAYANWQQLIQGLENLGTLTERPIEAVAALAPALDLETLSQSLLGWQLKGESEWGKAWSKDRVTVHCCTHRYGDCLNWGDIALAMAGTATEQFVGTGKPAIVIPGQGPQFTRLFAERQCDLLGESVILVDRPDGVGAKVLEILGDPERLTAIALNGHQRMGQPGAAQQIATALIELWS